MERWKLHLDILLHIIFVADLETKSRMVKTCHILHRAGGKSMLRSTDVGLYTRRQIVSFLLFMRADAPGRFPSVRALRLDPRGAHPMESTMLMAAFFLELADRGSALRSLYIGGHNMTDEWSNEELVRAVSKLQSITDLTLDLLDHGSWNTLRNNMLSHLVRADLTLPVPDPFPIPPALVAVDLIQLLEDSRDTLQCLTLVGSHMHKIETRKGPVYPCLETLELKGEWIPIAAHYITSFPALESLTVSQEHPLFLSDQADQAYGSVRRENKRYQRVRGSWPSLEYFMGTTQHLYLLGLNCHVYQVCLDDIDESVSATMMRAVLDDVRPVRLELASYANFNFLKSEWMEALCTLRDPQMTTLKIKIKLLGEAEEGSLEVAIVSPSAWSVLVER
ncbi:hypothetical protein C8T65DRAFT_107296 [Cerioporus squamosus]|nr:hypothetical protein C8T65DRAFT_107296 [Cerioporus squamosus]